MGVNQEQIDRAILLKTNLIVHIIRSQKCSSTSPKPLIYPQKAQKGQKGPTWGHNRNKTMRLQFQNQNGATLKTKLCCCNSKTKVDSLYR